MSLPQPLLRWYSDTMSASDVYGYKGSLMYRTTNRGWVDLDDYFRERVGGLHMDMRIVIQKVIEVGEDAEEIPWQQVIDREVYLANSSTTYIVGARRGYDGSPIFTDVSGIEYGFNQLNAKSGMVLVAPET